MKRILPFFITILFFIPQINANTTRDLTPLPDYNPEKIKKHIIMYINLERVDNVKPAFIINKKLNAAAQWHSDYMSSEEKLAHVTNKKGLHDVQERAVYFGEKIDRYAEIICSSGSLSSEGVPFIKKKDSGGEYIDFEKTTVNWLTEFEIALAMRKSILNDPVYKNYLSNENLNSIGGGISNGKLNGLPGWYASFAIVEKKDLLKYKLKMAFKKEAVKKVENGKETEETVIKYSFSGLPGQKAAVLAVSPSGVYRAFDYPLFNGQFSLSIDDNFRSRLAADEKLYISNYDAENDTYYPVARIEVIK